MGNNVLVVCMPVEGILYPTSWQTTDIASLLPRSLNAGNLPVMPKACNLLWHAQEAAGLPDGSGPHLLWCRQLGTSALQALAGRLEQPSAVEALCARLLGILSGKAEGKLKGAYERVGLAGGLQALASGAPATVDLSQLADSTADSLCSLYK